MTDQEKVKLYDLCRNSYDKLPETDDLFDKTLYELICYCASEHLKIFNYNEINNEMKINIVTVLLNIVNRIKVFNDPKSFSNISYLIISTELNHYLIDDLFKLTYFPEECVSDNNYNRYTNVIEHFLIWDNYSICNAVSRYKLFGYMASYFGYRYDNHLDDVIFAPELILYCLRNNISKEKFINGIKFIYANEDYLLNYWDENYDSDHDEELDTRIVMKILDGSINNREIR